MSFFLYSCSWYNFLAGIPWSSPLLILNSPSLRGSAHPLYNQEREKKAATFLLRQALVARCYCVGEVPASHYVINFKLITPFTPFFPLLFFAKRGHKEEPRSRILKSRYCRSKGWRLNVHARPLCVYSRAHCTPPCTMEVLRPANNAWKWV